MIGIYYEFFAAAFPHQAGEYGERVNTIRKYVFSSTLKEADWSNSCIVNGDVAAEVGKLKSRPVETLLFTAMACSGKRC